MITADPYKKQSNQVSVPHFLLKLETTPFQVSTTQIMAKKDENIIRLNQFLKWQGIAATGGQAKLMVQGGEVLVNGIIETRRGRQLVSGDQVTVAGKTFEVDLNNAY